MKLVIGRLRADAGLSVLVVLGAIALSSSCPTQAMEGPTILAQAESPKIFHGVGKVTGIDAASGSLLIAHEDIPGLMNAMEMQFRVQPPDSAKGLKVGDKIEFGVDGKTWTILELKKLPPDK